jgi:hypothetical protein
VEPKKFWSLLWGLFGKRPISFGKDTLTAPSRIAEGFIRQYVLHPCSDPLTWRIRRKLYKSHPLDHNFSPFTPAKTEEVIRASKNSTATGPDGLTSLHLKNLGPSGIAYLTGLFNLSVRDAVVSAIWKKALVILVLKLGKPPDVSSSYRPISLLSPVVKLLERLLLPSLSAVFVMSPTHHGFRPGRSTTTALLPLVA